MPGGPLGKGGPVGRDGHRNSPCRQFNSVPGHHPESRAHVVSAWAFFICGGVIGSARWGVWWLLYALLCVLQALFDLTDINLLPLFRLHRERNPFFGLFDSQRFDLLILLGGTEATPLLALPECFHKLIRVLTRIGHLNLYAAFRRRA